MHRLALVATLLVTAVLAAGCGSDESSSDTSSTTDWAGNLCTAVSTWTTALTSSVQSLQGGNVSRDALESTADDVKSATDTLIDDLKSLGKPDTEAGEQAKESIDQLTDELEQEVDTIEGAVDDVSGVSGVVSAVSAVSGALGSMGTQLTSTLSDLEQLDAKGELQSAFEQSASCQELTSSSG
jgi:uncharacterized protein YoxC